NLVSNYSGQLVLIIQQREQSSIDVDRAVRKSESVGDRIAQSAELPVNIFKLLISGDRGSDTVEVSIQHGVVIDRAFLFETLVEQFDFAEKLLVHLPKDEFLVADCARPRRCHAPSARGHGQGSKDQADYEYKDLGGSFSVQGSTY